MTRRGSYAKGLAKREEILTTALDLVARNGYRRTTVRELADAVGLSQAGLMHHFGSKEELFTEILRRRDEADRAEFLGDGESADLPDAYVRLVRHNAGVPGLVRLYNRVSAEAVEPEHPSHEYFGERYRALRADTAEAIRRLQAEGRMPAAADPDKLAVLVTALLDGLQTAWLYDGGTDMAEHVAHFWELVRGE
ncbi:MULTISPECIES: TetR/AcrR family transcriptional regulator [Actinosynnema]|uniref:TetR/AcrR family transcriptional regulator n=1 Tax=Actinosynnema TaxID=40566 RepID=UPI000A739876|nr:TetR/AcrR family transcriptional regulator [Actinosynnema pretiosum]